jgi:hypothetical protein
MLRVVLAAAIGLVGTLAGCAARSSCCCPRVCAPCAANPSASPGPADPALQARLQAAADKTLYDEVFNANVELQACLVAAAELADTGESKKRSDACIAKFQARMKAAKESDERARETLRSFGQESRQK